MKPRLPARCSLDVPVVAPARAVVRAAKPKARGGRAGPRGMHTRAREIHIFTKEENSGTHAHT